MQSWGEIQVTERSYLTFQSYSPKPLALTMIGSTVGTVIGNMTAGGSNAASFDGTNFKTFSACSIGSAGSTGYVGKDWGSGNTKVIAQVKFYSPSDRNFDGGTGSDAATLSLYGSSDNSTWTSLGSLGSVAYPVNSSATLLSSQITQTTGYRYHKAENSNPFQPFFSQIQFFDMQ